MKTTRNSLFPIAGLTTPLLAFLNPDSRRCTLLLGVALGSLVSGIQGLFFGVIYVGSRLIFEQDIPLRTFAVSGSDDTASLQLL